MAEKETTALLFGMGLEIKIIYMVKTEMMR